MSHLLHQTPDLRAIVDEVIQASVYHSLQCPKTWSIAVFAAVPKDWSGRQLTQCGLGSPWWI